MKRMVKLLGISSIAGAALLAGNASANHPVLVEGEWDFDGDGRIGLAEDNDGTDGVFGTITAALGAANGGINQNGRITIVTSGRFAEVVNITAANGNVTLEAAPGVEANIDAVITGPRALDFPASTNLARQGAPGIIVNAPSNRYVSIRNVVSRNWTNGIDVRGGSRVAIENCRLENNVNYGILVQDTAKVKIDNCAVHATGFRTGAAAAGQTNNFPTQNTPMPGNGIEFEDQSRGAVFRTEVSGSFGAGISSTRGNVETKDVYLFDNNPDQKNEGRGRDR